MGEGCASGVPWGDGFGKGDLGRRRSKAEELFHNADHLVRGNVQADVPDRYCCAETFDEPCQPQHRFPSMPYRTEVLNADRPRAARAPRTVYGSVTCEVFALSLYEQMRKLRM
jgi:hypothetical protein